MQPLRELEAVLVAQVDVDERHVRTELRHESNRLGTVGRNPDDVQPLTCEQVGGALEKESVVVDYDAPHRHPLRIHNCMRVRIPANWNPWAAHCSGGTVWSIYGADRCGPSASGSCVRDVTPSFGKRRYKWEP